MANAAFPEPLERAFLSGAAMLLRIDLGGVLIPATAFLAPRAIQLGPPQLWMRAPTLANGGPFPAPVGTPISVAYLVGAQRYTFDTWLSSVRPYPGGRNADVWIVRSPASVAPQQRRSAVRLSHWIKPPLKIKIWSISPAAAGGGPPLLEGAIEDLSATGIGVLMQRQGARRFPSERIVGLNFRLNPDAPPIVLRGQVRTRRGKPKSNLIKLGIAFLDTTSHPDHAYSINQVTRYVTEQERLQIQRERGDR